MNSSANHRFRRRRRWFPFFAILFGLSLLALAEVVVRWCGGGDLRGNDPFAGFSETRPLFVQTGDGAGMEISTARRGFFALDQFPVPKPRKQRRIFVLGGSTVQGRPWSIETSFASFLEDCLSCACPEETFDVINCGGVSYASYRLVPILHECLEYEPDLIILCTGQNEFLEEFEFAEVRDPSVANRADRWLDQLASYRLLRRLMSGSANSKTESVERLSGEVDALLDHRGGLEVYRRDDVRRRLVETNFGLRLRECVQACRGSSVPLLLVRPPVNYSDCPPFKSEPDDDLTQDERALLAETVAESLAVAGRDPGAAVRLLESAVELSPRFAFGWYQLGRLYQAEHRTGEALEAFQRAVDEDVCPLRMTSGLVRTMQQVAREEDVTLVDLHEFLRARLSQKILGSRYLVDHIHPSLSANQKVARLLMTEALPLLKLSPGQGFDECAAGAMSERLGALPDLYFLRGQRTLDDVRGWAAGRADGPPLVRDRQGRIVPGIDGE